MHWAPCHKAILNGNSSLTYHDDVMRATQAKKGPSAKPTAKRASAKPAGDLTRGKRIVGIDHPILAVSVGLAGCIIMWYRGRTYMIAGMTIRGLYLDNSRAPGS